MANGTTLFGRIRSRNWLSGPNAVPKLQRHREGVAARLTDRRCENFDHPESKDESRDFAKFRPLAVRSVRWIGMSQGLHSQGYVPLTDPAMA